MFLSKIRKTILLQERQTSLPIWAVGTAAREVCGACFSLTSVRFGPGTFNHHPPKTHVPQLVDWSPRGNWIVRLWATEEQSHDRLNLLALLGGDAESVSGGSEEVVPGDVSFKYVSCSWAFPGSLCLLCAVNWATVAHYMFPYHDALSHCAWARSKRSDQVTMKPTAKIFSSCCFSQSL